MVNYHRLILALTDEELESFTQDWISSKKKSFYEITSFSGPSDMGRDVVAFISSQKHEGAWYNYQCKQYKNNLPTNTALLEIGKILYFAFLGNFTPPERYYFVAPRGINRNLETLIYKPNEFKERLISDWDIICSTSIIEGKVIKIDAQLKEFIRKYDFSKIGRLTMRQIFQDEDITPILFKRFSYDPGPAPEGIVPNEISNTELNYISELVDAYSEREKVDFKGATDLYKKDTYKEHLKLQRIRFYDADSFKRFYRDNTDRNEISGIEKEVFHGVIDKCNESYLDRLERINTVMAHAATLQPTGILAKHTPTTVKQGLCHHFVNDRKMTWKK